MKILNKEKLADVLTQNWTKFIDYRALMSLAINSVQLYAKNWSLLEDNKKRNGNKITISKTSIKQNKMILWLEFEVQIDKNVAIGTIELAMDLEGNLQINQTVGNIFYSN